MRANGGVVMQQRRFLGELQAAMQTAGEQHINLPRRMRHTSLAQQPLTLRIQQYPGRMTRAEQCLYQLLQGLAVAGGDGCPVLQRAVPQNGD